MAFRRCGVLVVAAVVGLAVGVPPAVGADASSKNGRIAFTRDFLDVWSMRPDGSSPVNLTADSAAADWMPSWRPDGRKLAFMSNRVTPTNPGPDPDYEIFVMNADGSGVRQLTANALDDETPSWSPDGHKLVFQRDFNPIAEQVDYDLFTMHADGTHQRNLTSSPGVNEQEADWSPNDRRIAFASDRDGDFELYTMRPDGSRVRQLTNNQGPDDRNPAWSPDGRRIAFDSNRGWPGGRDLHHARPRQWPDSPDLRPGRQLPPRLVAGRPPDCLHQLPGRQRRDLHDARRWQPPGQPNPEPGVRPRP
jgi:dipeptidyl aminopeptidase/acylaminoacyl peptidase